MQKYINSRRDRLHSGRFAKVRSWADLGAIGCQSQFDHEQTFQSVHRPHSDEHQMGLYGLRVDYVGILVTIRPVGLIDL